LCLAPRILCHMAGKRTWWLDYHEHDRQSHDDRRYMIISKISNEIHDHRVLIG